MASIIKLKRSSTSGSVPGSLELGEIAVNLFDRRLYVGNTTGVTAVGGEEFKFTTQANSSVVELKLLGETTSTSNTVALHPGEGIDITRNANGSITFAAEDATSSNKGVASFSTDNFSVSSGVVTIKNDGVILGTETTGNYVGTITAGDGIDTTGAATGEGIGHSISLEKASTSNLGGAIFNSNNFVVDTAGLVSVKDNGIALGTESTGNYVATVAAGNNSVVIGGSGSETADVTVSLGGEIGANTTGFARKLETGRTIGMTGDVVWTSGSFDGTGNVTGTATIQPNSVALGTDTTGNYVATIAGTSNEIEVSGSGSETAAVTIGLPDDVTIGQDLTVTRNAVINGNLTVEGATTYLSTSTVYADDGMFKLSANNPSNSIDTGIYAKYVVDSTTKYAGYFRDATDGVFKFYKDTQAEPTTTVNTSGTGYALAQVDAIIDGGTY